MHFTIHARNSRPHAGIGVIRTPIFKSTKRIPINSGLEFQQSQSCIPTPIATTTLDHNRHHIQRTTTKNAQTTITFTVKGPTTRNTRNQNQCQETRDPKSIRVPSTPHCLMNQMQQWWRSATTLYNTLYKIARFFYTIHPLQSAPKPNHNEPKKELPFMGIMDANIY